MTIDKGKLAEHIIGGSVIATLLSLSAGLITGLFVYLWKDFQYFLRPENAHYTEYNTPHFIEHTLMVQGYQDPLTIVMMLIPFILFFAILIFNTKAGEYRVKERYSI